MKGIYNKVTVDKRFIRTQTALDNFYFTSYGKNADFSRQYTGQIKCKLIHSKNDSIIFPDQLFVNIEDDRFDWIQPMTILVNLLVKDDNVIQCGFYIDISAGNTLKVVFTNIDLLCRFKDNSSLFNCRIYGPENLSEFVTGNGKFVQNIPYLKLYHHTLPKNKALIQQTQQIKLSSWNIQGTKKLTNIGYFYLTCLDRIKANSDLQQIAMSSDGIIRLLLDNYTQPKFISTNSLVNIRQGILELNVYRENTSNRTAVIEFWVDSTVLAPKHVWMHLPKNRPKYYEICMPFIYRIGGFKDEVLSYSDPTISQQVNIKYLDYQVVGICTKFKGLEAPYDEENTEHIFKIEKVDKNTNILDFWFENTNSDQFSNKIINFQEFE